MEEDDEEISIQLLGRSESGRDDDDRKGKSDLLAHRAPPPSCLPSSNLKFSFFPPFLKDENNREVQLCRSQTTNFTALLIENECLKSYCSGTMRRQVEARQEEQSYWSSRFST